MHCKEVTYSYLKTYFQTVNCGKYSPVSLNEYHLAKANCKTLLLEVILGIQMHKGGRFIWKKKHNRNIYQKSIFLSQTACLAIFAWFHHDFEKYFGYLGGINKHGRTVEGLLLLKNSLAASTERNRYQYVGLVWTFSKKSNHKQYIYIYIYNKFEYRMMKNQYPRKYQNCEN